MSRPPPEFLPPVYIPSREDANADRCEDTAHIHGFRCDAHFLILFVQQANSAADERGDQQFRGDDGRRQSVGQGLHRREGGHGTIADRVR